MSELPDGATGGDALHWLSVAELSRRIHAGSLSPVELMAHLLDRVEAMDGALNAFRLIPRERAMAAAQAAETMLRAGLDSGALHGIPYAVKDIIDVQGLPTTAGSDLLSDNVAAQNATVVRQLCDAGMVLLGKTQTVQFAMGAPGINHHHGTPHNPWAEAHHVPGGSSSGSAVAVAAGLVPMALGTDTGGSVRIPAALCGTVGLKTTIGQVSRAGVFPVSTTLDSVGPLTRTVEDAALVYQALHGADVLDATTAGAVAQDVMDGLKDGVVGLRVAVGEGIFWDRADPEVATAVRAAADVLADLGAHVDVLSLPEAEQALDANPQSLISSAEALLAHQDRVGDRFEEYDPILAHRFALARSTGAADYLRALEACRTLARQVEKRLRDVDAFIAPTTAIPALPLAEVDADLDTYRKWNALYSRNTSIGNLLGLCALSLPCGFTGEGLPIGLSIHGKARAEAQVLRIGHAFEQATDWHRGRPEQSWVR